MITMIPRSKLEPHPDNPRRDLGDLSELAASIKKSGILQNLTVVPSPREEGIYRIIIGHRRFAATAIAGYSDDDELPCAIEEMDIDVYKRQGDSRHQWNTQNSRASRRRS